MGVPKTVPGKEGKLYYETGATEYDFKLPQLWVREEAKAIMGTWPN